MFNATYTNLVKIFPPPTDELLSFRRTSMIYKTMSVTILLGILSSCAHKIPQAPKYSTPLKRVSSWMAVLNKSPSPSLYRIPASSKLEVKGIEEFILAVKSHPQVFELPIGHKIVTLYGEKEVLEVTRKEEVIYLKQNKNGYFVLRKGEEDKEAFLEAHDRVTMDSFETSLRATRGLKEIKRISVNKFRIILADDHYEGVLCGVEVDVTKSLEFSEKACIDNKTGVTLSRQKMISYKPTNMDVLSVELKSKQLSTFPSFLTCGSEGFPEAGYCSVVDDEEKDWSFLVTR